MRFNANIERELIRNFLKFYSFLLKITVPFQYAWLDELFREMATYVFFVVTGYKFRPATQSPYFNVSI